MKTTKAVIKGLKRFTVLNIKNKCCITTFNIILPNFMRTLITQKLASTFLLLGKNIFQTAMFILEFIKCPFPLVPRCLWKRFVYLFLTSHASFESYFMEFLSTLVFAQSCFKSICPAVISFQPDNFSGLTRL